MPHTVTRHVKLRVADARLRARAPMPCAGWIAREYLEDDYCDCADGSDELTTGACSMIPGTYFVCPLTLQGRIFSSRVVGAAGFEPAIPRINVIRGFHVRAPPCTE